MLTIAGLRYSRNLIIVHRLQWPLPVNTLCYATWGSLYAAGSPAQLWSPAVAAATVANMMLFVAGLALNALVDVPTDENHEDKSYQAVAVRQLGREHVGRWIAAEAAAGLALLIGVVFAAGHWMSLAVGLAILILQVLYNVSPLHLKGRGFLGAAAYGAAVPALPCLLAYWAVRSDLDLATCLIFVALGVLSAGRTGWWSVPDHWADTTAGLGTPSVLHGQVRATLVSCAVMAAGIGMLCVGLWWRFGPVLAALGTSVHMVVLMTALASLLSGQTRRARGDSRWFRVHVLPMVAFGEVAIAVVPLTQMLS